MTESLHRQRLQNARELVEAAEARAFVLCELDEPSVWSWGIEFRDADGTPHAFTWYADRSGHCSYASAERALQREGRVADIELTYLDEIPSQ
jgi:hypothetical protein